MSVSLRFSISRGCLVLKGSTINCLGEKWLAHCMSRCSDDERERLGQASAQRLQRDGDAYHITIISAPEMKALASCDSTLLVQSLNSSLLLKQSTLPLYDLGVGCYNDQCYYIILYSPFLQKTRLQLNLPPVDLHITLAFHQSDVHDVRKGFSTLWREKMTPEGRNQDNTNDNNTLVEFLTTIEQILQAKSTPKVREYLEYSRLAEVASRYGYLFGVYYLAKYCHHNNSVSSSCDVLEEAICDVNHCKVLKSKTASSTVSSTGPEGDVIDYGELVCKALNFQLYSPARCQYRLRRFYSSVIDINRYDISYVEMPRNFSFITDNVAGSSLPDTRQALTSLVAIGITDIITVMEKPLDKASTAGVPLDYHWFQVNDRTPPSVDQMRDMMGLLDRPGRKTLVHCLGGVGRTATVLGAYLMWSQGLSRQEAKQPLIENRRTILAPSQEEFLTSWYSTCLDHRTRTAATSTTAATTTNDTSIVKPLARTQTQAQAQTTKSVVKFPPLLMCVGYPASGKSTFAEALCASNPDR